MNHLGDNKDQSYLGVPFFAVHPASTNCFISVASVQIITFDYGHSRRQNGNQSPEKKGRGK